MPTSRADYRLPSVFSRSRAWVIFVPMSAEPPQFWLEFASTYSYLTAACVEREALAGGVALAWRPFLPGPIFADQGWTIRPATGIGAASD